MKIRFIPEFDLTLGGAIIFCTCKQFAYSIIQSEGGTNLCSTSKENIKKNCSDMTFLQHRRIHLTASHWTEQKFWYFAEKLRCNDWNYWEDFNFTTKRNWDVMFRAGKGNEYHSTQSLRIRHQVFLFIKILLIKNQLKF